MSFRNVRPVITIVTVVVTAVLLSTPMMAQITLPNPDFEMPPAPTKTEFWDANGAIIPGIIPGWEPTGPGVQGPGGPVFGLGDSGIEFGGIIGGGAQNQGYLAALDPSIYSVTNHNIVAGRSYRAEFSLRSIFADGGNTPAFEARLIYINGMSRVTLGTPVVINPTNVFRTYSVEISAAQAAPGVTFPLAIEVNNITDTFNANPLVNSWVAIDRFTFARPGDVDNDGDVDSFDYDAILANFHGSVATRADGDLIPNGVVDLEDFAAWKDNAPFPLLASLGLVSVPEPTSVVLILGMASLVLGFRVSRHRID